MCSTSCCCCCSLTSMWIREMPIFTKSCGNEKQHQQPRSEIQLKIHTSSEQSGNENIHTLNDHYQVNSVFKIAVSFASQLVFQEHFIDLNSVRFSQIITKVQIYWNCVFFLYFWKLLKIFWKEICNFSSKFVCEKSSDSLKKFKQVIKHLRQLKRKSLQEAMSR